MSAPKRAVVGRTRQCGRNRRQRWFVVLECGHADFWNGNDSRRLALHCWDCFYNKPAHYDAAELAEMKGNV